MLVLASLEGLEDAAVIADWAGQAAILVTSHAPLGLPGEQVVQVEPLGADASRELLQSPIHALGLQVDEAVLERPLRPLDGQPLELEVLAPTLGLFGDHALDEFDAHLTAPTAVVVTGRPAPVLVPSMLRLTRRSLLEPRSGRLALLSAVRRAARAAEGEQLVRARAHAAQRMTQWLVTHRDQALVDAARTLLPRRRDLEKALRRPTVRQTLEALAVPWVDLADLVGPHEDFLPALQEAAARCPASDVLWLSTLRLQAGCRRPPAMPRPARWRSSTRTGTGWRPFASSRWRRRPAETRPVRRSSTRPSRTT